MKSTMFFYQTCECENEITLILCYNVGIHYLGVLKSSFIPYVFP